MCERLPAKLPIKSLRAELFSDFVQSDMPKSTRGIGRAVLKDVLKADYASVTIIDLILKDSQVIARDSAVKEKISLLSKVLTGRSTS